MTKRTWLGRATGIAGVGGVAVGITAGGPGGGGDGSAGGGAGGDDELVTVGFGAVGPEGAWREANEQNIQDTFSEDAGFERKFAPAANLDQASQIQAFSSFIEDRKST